MAKEERFADERLFILFDALAANIAKDSRHVVSMDFDLRQFAVDQFAMGRDGAHSPHL